MIALLVSISAKADFVNLTAEEISKKIVVIQKLQPKTNKNTREGEKESSEWEEKKIYYSNK